MSNNLVKRGGTYYFRKTIRGERISVSLKTSDKTVAMARMKAKLANLQHKESDAVWNVLDKVRSKRLHSTLGAIFAVYREEAKARGIDARTAGSYISQLANIIRKVHGDQFDVENASAAILTGELLASYAKSEYLAAGDDILRQERVKGTIRSTIVNARSVFAKWTDNNGIYRNLSLSDLTGFKKQGTPWKVERKVYHRPPAPLIAKTVAAGRELRTSNPRLYAVFLLAYDLALRAGEAMAIEWTWFSTTAVEGAIVNHADIFRRPNFKPKWNMERSVPINADTWRELQELRQRPEWIQASGKPTPFVVPGAHETDRYNLVNREFAAWMRGLGWDAGTYPKTAHELRKLMGSEWFTKKTPQFAQEKLGHRNIATTCTFYARLSETPQALPREETKVA